MNNKDLIVYLKNVYELEKSNYFFQSIWVKIQEEIDDLSSFQDQSTESYIKYAPISDFYMDYGEEGSIGDAISGHFGSVIICTIVFIILGLLGVFKTMEQCIFLGVVIGFFLPLLIMIIKIIYNRYEVNQYNKIIKENNNVIIHKNYKNRQKCNDIISSLKKEQARCLSIGAEIYITLNEFYDLDIIYPKYRDLASISTIYEYMLSGRCSSLEGHGGAYDTFEYEKRLDHIIVKLDNIIELLDKIRVNQEQLYIAVNEGLNRSQEILNDMKISVNNIENNSVATMYYNKVIAQNTECIKWLEIFDSN